MGNFIGAGIAFAHSGEAPGGAGFLGCHSFGIMSGRMGWLFGSFGLIFWLLVFVLAVFGVVALAGVIRGGKIRSKTEKVYVCGECGYEYKDKEWMEKCQRWCREHKSCNIDIIKHGSPGEENN